jgi:hypothetical protein
MAHGGIFHLDLDDHTTSQPLEETDSDEEFSEQDDIDYMDDSADQVLCNS